MIHGIQANTTNVRQQLMTSPYEFYLTGSRFFGTAKPNSDWDFFVQQENSEALESFLKKLGFVQALFTSYKDMLVDKVYRNMQEKIDIQIVKSAKTKLAVQEYIYSLGKNVGFARAFHAMTKYEKTHVWDMAYCITQNICLGTGRNGRESFYKKPNYSDLVKEFK